MEHYLFKYRIQIDAKPEVSYLLQAKGGHLISHDIFGLRGLRVYFGHSTAASLTCTDTKDIAVRRADAKRQVHDPSLENLLTYADL